MAIAEFQKFTESLPYVKLQSDQYGCQKPTVSLRIRIQFILWFCLLNISTLSYKEKHTSEKIFYWGCGGGIEGWK